MSNVGYVGGCRLDHRVSSRTADIRYFDLKPAVPDTPTLRTLVGALGSVAEVQMFFLLEPEVAGGIGPNSDLHRDDGKLVVTRLNYEFDGWLGDALLETTPCFIVTNAARQLIERAALTGVSFADVEVTRSGLFTDLYGDKALPHFWWMIVQGEPEDDDFGLASDLRLVASERALSILKQAGLTHAEIEPVGG